MSVSEASPHADMLLQIAEELLRETVASEVQRVAVDAVKRLLSGSRAGWVVVGDDGPSTTIAVPDEAHDAEAVALAVEAASSRRLLCNNDLVCLPVSDGSTIEGVVYARRSMDAQVPNDVLERLAGLVVSALRTAALFNSLELMVANEMTRVVEREAEMQLVLDSMVEGLLVCDTAGVVGPIRSRAITGWFGSPGEATPLAAYFGDEKQAPWITIGFDSMRDGFLPFEVLAEQMPKTIQRDGRTYRVGFQPVIEGETLAKVVVTVRDITEALVQERTDRINREMPVIVGMLLRDRDQFRDFVDELGQLLQRLAADDTSLAEQLRVVHTIKGNAMLYGFGSFAEACHKLEDRVADDPANMNPEEVRALSAAWNESLARVSVFLDADDAGAPKITAAEYGLLLEYLNGRRAHDDIARLVASWSQRPIGPTLEPHAIAAQRAAERLGKEVRVVVDDGGLRLPRADLRGFCATLVHVVRNAVDHGLEPSAERLAMSKPGAGELRLEARVQDNNLLFVVQDDGRGIDWARLRTKAQSLNLPAETESELVEALFADGVSTRDEVSVFSGRGVGLSATRKACEDLGGAFRVRSEQGRGTSFEFSFPLG